MFSPPSVSSHVQVFGRPGGGAAVGHGRFSPLHRGRCLRGEPESEWISLRSSCLSMFIFPLPAFLPPTNCSARPHCLPQTRKNRGIGCHARLLCHYFTEALFGRHLGCLRCHSDGRNEECGARDDGAVSRTESSLSEIHMGADMRFACICQDRDIRLGIGGVAAWQGICSTGNNQSPGSKSQRARIAR